MHRAEELGPICLGRCARHGQALPHDKEVVHPLHGLHSLLVRDKVAEPVPEGNAPLPDDDRGEDTPSMLLADVLERAVIYGRVNVIYVDICEFLVLFTHLDLI